VIDPASLRDCVERVRAICERVFQSLGEVFSHIVSLSCDNGCVNGPGLFLGYLELFHKIERRAY